MTTLMIDDELGRKAGQLAAGEGKTLNQFVSDLLRSAIGGPSMKREMREGVPVLAIDPPQDIDPSSIRSSIEEDGF
jgi:hypothetical protein